MTPVELEERLIDFAVSVIQITEEMPARRSATHLTNQLLRASSSPALNYGEARSAESPNDFVHKIKIVLKELRETFNGLRIADKVGFCKNDKKMKQVLKENNELISIFVASCKTAMENIAMDGVDNPKS